MDSKKKADEPVFLRVEREEERHFLGVNQSAFYFPHKKMP